MISCVNKTKLSIKFQVREFSSTSIRRADPISTTVAAFTVPYAAGFLSNPLGGAFILLMGMATSLLGLTVSFLAFADVNEYGLILQRLDMMFSLYETHASYLLSGINILDTALDNFTPEILAYFYNSLQEHITLTERLFAELNLVMASPEVMFAGEPVVDRGDLALENLRLAGNELIRLIRNLEDRLNIPENDRVPSFWFED